MTFEDQLEEQLKQAGGSISRLREILIKLKLINEDVYSMSASDVIKLGYMVLRIRRAQV